MVKFRYYLTKRAANCDSTSSRGVKDDARTQNSKHGEGRRGTPLTKSCRENYSYYDITDAGEAKQRYSVYDKKKEVVPTRWKTGT